MRISDWSSDVCSSDVCTTCHSGVDAAYTRCYQCNSAAWLDPPEIVPIAMSIERELLHDHLRGYKDDPSEAAREQKVTRLDALTALWLKEHSDCQIGGAHV